MRKENRQAEDEAFRQELTQWLNDTLRPWFIFRLS